MSSIFATASTNVGLALEVTRGTPVTPAYWMSVRDPKYKPDIGQYQVATLQGSMVTNYQIIPGQRYDSHGWDSYPYADSFPLLAKALLGSTDTLSPVFGAATTLAANASIGATTISTTASVAVGSWIIVGTAGSATAETHLTTAVSGAGPYSVTIAQPLLFAQSSGAAVSGLNGHLFGLLNNTASTANQPPSCTITDFDGEEWRQLAGCQLGKLSMKGSATGLVDYTVDWVCNAATTPSAPSPSVEAVGPSPGWSSQIAIGGTTIGYVEDWSVDLDRQTKPIPAMTGTQAYFTNFAATLNATGKLTLIEQSGAPELAKYLAATNNSLTIKFTNTGGYAFLLTASNCRFTTGELDRSQPHLRATVDFELLPSTTDATSGGVAPLTITVANAVTTTY